MSVAARIDDVMALMQLGRWEGALLNVLIAIAASSRKRFPQETTRGTCPGCVERTRRRAQGDRRCPRSYTMTPGTGACDHHAFETFLDQEFWKHTPIAIRGDDGVMSVALGGEQHSFEHIIYAFFRCELAHEGQLPVSVTFEGDPTSLELFVRGGDAGSPFVLSRSHLDLFIRTVTAAPENADQFPTRVVHLLQALATSQACSAATTAAAQGTTVEEVERVFGDFSVAGLCRHDEGAHTWIFTPGDAQTPLQLIEKARAAGLDLQRCLARASG